MTKQEYKEYLKSRRWKIFKNKIYKKYKVCQKCGKGYSLDVHHISYKNLGNESERDVILLCRQCHYTHHNSLRGFIYLHPSDIIHIIYVWIVKAYRIPNRSR